MYLIVNAKTTSQDGFVNQLKIFVAQHQERHVIRWSLALIIRHSLVVHARQGTRDLEKTVQVSTLLSNIE